MCFNSLPALEGRVSRSRPENRGDRSMSKVSIWAWRFRGTTQRSFPRIRRFMRLADTLGEHANTPG